MCYQSTMEGSRVLKRNAYLALKVVGFLVMGECRANRQPIWPSFSTEPSNQFLHAEKEKGKKKR